MREKISRIYLIGIALLFPLVIHRSYFDILETKQAFYMIWTLAALFAFLLCAAIKGDTQEKNLKNIEMRRPAWMIWGGCFLAAALLSAICSPYRAAAFTGSEGRYQGVMTLALYGVTFFLVMKGRDRKKEFVSVCLVSGAAVCILGLCQQLMLDPFGWLGQIQAFERPMFLSTIGYINFFSCYMVMMWALTLGMCCFAVGPRHVIYWAAFVLFSCGILIGNSDSGYLAAAGVFAAAAAGVRGGRQAVRLTAAAGLFCVTVSAAGIWLGHGRPLADLSGKVAGNRAVLAVGLACLCAAALAAGYRHISQPRREWRRKKWLLLTAAAAVAVTVAAVCALFGDDGWRTYLIWSDQWGSGRGCIWRLAWEEWIRQPFWRKLIGSGPDTAALFLRPRDGEMTEILGYTVNNVHNEYFQYLITTGVLGLAAYLGFVYTALRRIWRERRNSPERSGLFLAAAAYLFQAAVSINQSVTTPFLVICIAAALAKSREEKKEIQNLEKSVKFWG